MMEHLQVTPITCTAARCMTHHDRYPAPTRVLQNGWSCILGYREGPHTLLELSCQEGCGNQVQQAAWKSCPSGEIESHQLPQFDEASTSLCISLPVCTCTCIARLFVSSSLKTRDCKESNFFHQCQIRLMGDPLPQQFLLLIDPLP